MKITKSNNLTKTTFTREDIIKYVENCSIENLYSIFDLIEDKNNHSTKVMLEIELKKEKEFGEI